MTGTMNEELAAANETLYYDLFHALDDGFCIIEMMVDPTGKPYDYRFLEVNPTFERQTGLNNAVGKTARQLVPNLEEHWFETYGKVALTGEATRFVNGSDTMGRWFDVYAVHVGGATSHKVAIVFRDISERKRHEANLAFLASIAEEFSRLSNPDEIIETVGAKVGTFLNVSSCIFVDVDDSRGKLTVQHGWNSNNVPSLQQTFRLSDYLTEEFSRANRAGEMVVVRDTQQDWRTDAAAYAALQIRTFVTVPFHKDGVWTACLSVTDAQPRDWRDDEIELIREISDRIFPRIERARSQLALRDSYEFNQDVLDSLALHIGVLDSLGVITAVNEAWKLFALENGADWTMKGVGIGTNYLEVCKVEGEDDSEDAGAVYEGIKGVLSGERNFFSLEYPCHSPTTKRWFLLTVSPLARGGAVVSHLNVTERRLIEEALREANKRLEQFSDKQKRFVADAAHELRAPLTSIQGNLQMLNVYKDVAGSVRDEMMTDVQRETERLGRLVNDLLAIARGDNSLTLEKTSVFLEQILLSAWRGAKMLGSQTPGSQHRFELAELAHAELEGNEDRLKQLALILLENAVKYTPSGGTISLGLQAIEEHTLFYVRDTGIGIGPEDLPHVFERFYRADKARTRGHETVGTGLGLSIAEWIVAQHGGRIWLESKVEEGTTVWVRLPRQVENSLNARNLS